MQNAGYLRLTASKDEAKKRDKIAGVSQFCSHPFFGDWILAGRA